MENNNNQVLPRLITETLGNKNYRALVTAGRVGMFEGKLALYSDKVWNEKREEESHQEHPPGTFVMESVSGGVCGANYAYAAGRFDQFKSLSSQDRERFDKLPPVRKMMLLAENAGLYMGGVTFQELLTFAESGLTSLNLTEAEALQMLPELLPNFVGYGYLTEREVRYLRKQLPPVAVPTEEDIPDIPLAIQALERANAMTGEELGGEEVHSPSPKREREDPEEESEEPHTPNPRNVRARLFQDPVDPEEEAQQEQEIFWESSSSSSE